MALHPAILVTGWFNRLVEVQCPKQPLQGSSTSVVCKSSTSYFQEWSSTSPEIMHQSFLFVPIVGLSWQQVVTWRAYASMFKDQLQDFWRAAGAWASCAISAVQGRLGNDTPGCGLQENWWLWSLSKSCVKLSILGCLHTATSHCHVSLISPAFTVSLNLRALSMAGFNVETECCLSALLASS